MIRALLLGLCAVASAASAGDYRPGFRPDRLKGASAGPPNVVMVLGTPHLSGWPEDFRVERLAPLLDRLAGWRPDAIATEDLSGLQCDALRRHPARWRDTVEAYCFDPAEAGAATGLDVPTATAEAERMIAAGVSLPAERRRLAAVLLAAGEPASALVQWLRLDERERRAGDGLDAPLVARLERMRGSRNESYAVAAVLAARLGHQRVWPVDDHSADQPLAPDEAEKWGKALEAAWENPATKRRQALDAKLTAGLARADGVLAWYRAVNAPDAARIVHASDFGAALADRSAGRFGRRYVGDWETRNLRMVANIRDVLALRPGMKLLAIVGASHKGYYEAYLNQMHDVRLADPLLLLR